MTDLTFFKQTRCGNLYLTPKDNREESKKLQEIKQALLVFNEYFEWLTFDPAVQIR